MQTIINAEDLGIFADFLNQPVEVEPIDLSDAKLIDCIKAKIEVKNRTSPKYGSRFATTFKVLSGIEETYKCTIMPSKVNEFFWSYFIPLIQMQGYRQSTMKTVVSQIKAAVGWSAQYGAKISPSYAQIQVSELDIQRVALTPDDISRIFHLDIDKIPRRKQHRKILKLVRDMFCLMCNLGLRYSDARRLTKEHFHDGICRLLSHRGYRYPFLCIV